MQPAWGANRQVPPVWQQGVIKKGDRVVAVLTGHVLKDPGILARIHQEMEPPPLGANRPIEIDASVRAVERVMSNR
jgi:threonine synthase